ncbi:hypothetical protein RWV98_13540 [Agathobaculum sp. NTUH-O15-33]|uniref:hypothetical protein n=1 Tax=Agathobaculum sp. NTUH-O15-33 TaxID=3079302 RepID=UPI0029587EAD|nr:hypothetical protein [Agathobaculum sp. NTUH-O15-33]WNX83613.1 hypothetical protein RWV98_13540 [Agathobaculum sp. NTUH-O15-33]
MGVFVDLFKSIKDMKALGKLMEKIQPELDRLEAEGKLPADLKTAMDAVKNADSTKGASAGETAGKLEHLVQQLEQHEDLFPDSFKSLISKFESVSDDLEGIAKRVDGLNKK